VHAAALDRVGHYLERVLESFHAAHPEREGMTRAELAGKLSLIFSDKEVGVVLQRLVKRERIEQQGGAGSGQTFALKGHRKSVSGEQEAGVSRLIEAIRKGGAQPARRGALLDGAGLDEKTGQHLLNLASHSHQLVRVKDDLYYTPDILAGIEERLRGFLTEHRQITVIEFKELTGVTRKHAVDLLEHFDAQRVTLRLEDHRVLRQGA
jgi:selenocysteine-specific elongation factor